MHGFPGESSCECFACIESALPYPRTSLAFFAPKREVHSSRPSPATGSTSYVRYGCQRQPWQMMSSWNLSLELRKYRNSDGDSYAPFPIFCTTEMLRRSRGVRCAMRNKELAYNVPRHHVLQHSMLRARARRSS